MRTIIAVVVILCSAVGCGNPINRKTSQNYTNAGYAAIQSGDWKLAQRNFGRAIVNAELGGAKPLQVALLKYEYGRASGVVCDWSNAEVSLKEAFELDSANGGPAYMSLYEAGRMFFDKKQFAAAKSYYERVFVEFKRIDADTKDPLGYAEYLEEYAVVLRETGAEKEAMPYVELSAKIKATFPAGKKHTEKTPYGTQCS